MKKSSRTHGHIRIFFHKGEAKGSQRTLANVIEAHFPEIVPLVQKYIDTIVDLEVLQGLVVKASTAEKKYRSDTSDN